MQLYSHNKPLPLRELHIPLDSQALSWGMGWEALERASGAL